MEFSQTVACLFSADGVNVRSVNAAGLLIRTTKMLDNSKNTDYDN